MDTTTRTPLEEFLRNHVEVTGGVWDEVEPQVYDILLPTEGQETQLRIAFDPEALPEHPGAQLASYGTPLVDRLLAEAVNRGRYSRLHLVGLNLSPHDLPGRVPRGLMLPPDSSLKVERIRPLNFPQAVFWFQATFMSDQKEQEILPVGLDLHYGRQVRRLEELLSPSRLSETPTQYLPEARRLSLAAAYPLTRERVIRTLAAIANTRSREGSEHSHKQIERMVQYYSDLRQELEEQIDRARSRGDDLSRFAGRKEALEREERVRVSELRQKSALRLQLRLLQLLVVQQPKIWLRATVTRKSKPLGVLELVWDPLIEALEAVPCPECGKPTLTFELDRMGHLVCPASAAAPAAKPLRR